MSLRGRNRNMVQDELSKAAILTWRRQEKSIQAPSSTNHAKIPYSDINNNPAAEDQFHAETTQHHDTNQTITNELPAAVWPNIPRLTQENVTTILAVPNTESGAPAAANAESSAPDATSSESVAPGIPNTKSAPPASVAPEVPNPASEVPGFPSPESEAPAEVPSPTSEAPEPNVVSEAPAANTATNAPAAVVANEDTSGTSMPEPSSDAPAEQESAPTEKQNAPAEQENAPTEQESESGSEGGIAGAGAAPAAMTKAPDNLPIDKPLVAPTKNASPSCNTLSCKGLATLNEHPILYIVIFFVVTFFCCLRCKVFGGRQTRDPRGEYRAVGRMLANNFDTELTEEDMNFYASDEDDDDPNSNGWTNRSKGSIELGSIGVVDEANGGLTLEEMNG